MVIHQPRSGAVQQIDRSKYRPYTFPEVTYIQYITVHYRYRDRDAVVGVYEKIRRKERSRDRRI